MSTQPQTPVDVALARKHEAEGQHEVQSPATFDTPVPPADSTTTDDTQSVIEDKVQGEGPGFGEFKSLT